MVVENMGGESIFVFVFIIAETGLKLAMIIFINFY